MFLDKGKAYEDTDKRTWTSKVVIRYILFQLPITVVLALILILARESDAISTWLIGGLLMLWIAKDVFLFPFVWRAYDPDRPKNKQPMVGMRGVATEPLAPTGYIKVHGELWKARVAESNHPIEKGEDVRVQGISGIVLLVKSDFSKRRTSGK